MQCSVYQPVMGRVIPAGDISDPVFRDGSAGFTIGIETVEGKVYAPFDGKVTTVIDSKHAIGITSEDGIELLVHVGIDTVKLQGEGFDCQLKVGQSFKKGELLLSFDLDYLKEKGYDTTTVVVVCNVSDYQEIMVSEKAGSVGALLLTCRKVPEEKGETAPKVVRKKKVSVMQYVQKLGKAIMLPVAMLPICGLLMGIGYALCPASMQGGEIAGLENLIGLFFVKAGSALIDNIAILFAIGVGVGMSEKNDGTGGLAAIASWLMMTTLLHPDFVTKLLPEVAQDKSAMLAFGKIANPFIGIIAGMIGAACYNRFKDVATPSWLAFFSGKRCVSIIAGVVSIVVSAILLFVWPVVFGGLVSTGQMIAGMGNLGAAVYVFLNRLLIPFGMHHALNNVFWFDTIGIGDLTHYWAGHTSADVTWSLGMYMTGFFPCIMFGVPGAALAMVHAVKDKGKRRAAVGLLLSAAICAFVCGVTEPFEFSFLFVAPLLYAVYSVMYGVVTYIALESGFRAGFCFSGGAIDLTFSSSLPAAANTWMILPLGLGTFVAFYAVFRILIERMNFDHAWQGRNDGGCG